MKVIIDPGHGGFDPGALGPTGLREADVNLAVAKRVANLLSPSVQAVLTRDGDTSPGTDVNTDLQNRATVANGARADYFVSIHCNAADNAAANGTEVYCYKFGGKGEQLARTIARFLVPALGLRDRGVKEANFYVLRQTVMPAVLIELAFITNRVEESLLRSPLFQAKAAEAIARGIGAFLGIGDPVDGGNEAPLGEELPSEAPGSGGGTLMSAPGPFTDVAADRPTAAAITRALERGLIQGDGEGSFRPADPLTREEAVLLIDRAINYLLAKVKAAGITIDG
ncbi:N-acetylmuramoyl-L-alanine amidase [Heliomicrobium modesticaldum]|uniref:N-acetylmuramoyl-L-alanine amidase n=1 Tax=Heliomicrobium modesticaldum TaxID=35701 RepID=UPI0002FCC47F|nr:N-acetylmuramoyl-L-alanine amidase [Heliomicrobium modesticaldum]